MAINSKVEAEPNDVTRIPDSEVSAVVEHEAVVEVLEFGSISSDCWNPVPKGETLCKTNENGNPTIFWDESIEPPEPFKDFESLQEYEAAWQQWEENSNNSICAAESVQVSPSVESSPGKLSYADCAKPTPGVKKYCSNDSLVSQSTTTLENSQESQESISSPHRRHVNPSPLKENASVEPTSETVSPQYCEESEQSNHYSFVWKTSLDCYRHPYTPENCPEHTLNTRSESFMNVGTMQSGLLLERNLDLEPSGKVKDSYSLPRPGALSKSSPTSRPPGNTKSEAKAKKLGLIGKNEVFNPEWLEQEFGLPIGWTDPQEHRAATELLERDEQHSETVSTPGSVKSSGSEYFTSTHLLNKEQSGNYNTTTPDTLKAISLWQPWASLIPLGLKHYETRSWRTKYRGRLLICSTANNSKHYQQYLKIKDQLQLLPWNETNFPHGYALAICDLVDCIEMTPEFIAQQSQTEILCGDWQLGRYAWKLENIQPITEPFAVKGKQGLFNVSVDLFQLQRDNSGDEEESSPSNNLLCSPKLIGLYPKLSSPELLLGDKKETSPSKIELSPSKSPSNLLGDKEESSPSNSLSKSISSELSPSNLLGDEEESSPSKNPLHSPSKIELSPSKSPSNLLGDKEESSPSNSPSKNISPSKKRNAQEGNGYIHWRTITKNGKEYPQAYYHWKEGNKKRSKYIPKKLLSSVEEAEAAKRPVVEILKLLGIETSPNNLLGDKESSPSNNNAIVNVSGNANKLLGDKWINNGETNISQGFQGSPSNLDNSPSKIELSPSKRRKGDGSGSIHWRTITRGGKDYPQAYYHYEIWEDGDRAFKSSKYIPKRLLSQVQRLDARKTPVKEILKLLGVII